MNIKSLLLGSAAALAAVSGAQAADAIVAAEPEPMEYVRVCDAFGTGYFYIPGTETCLKIGGYVRFQTNFGRNDGDPNNTSDWDTFTRGQLQFDAKNDTELGTLESVIVLQTNADTAGGQNDGGNNTFLDTASFAIAGFKFGYYYSWWDDGIAGETDALATNTLFNSISYTYDGGAFKAGVSVDELEGLGRALVPTNPRDTPNDFGRKDNGVGVAGMLSGSVGGVTATLLGGYDTEREDGAVRAIFSAELGAGTFNLAGIYASGPNAYYNESEWTVAASYDFKATDKLTITPAAQYFGEFEFNDGADAWRVGLTAGYQITDGLKALATVQYQDEDDAFFRGNRVAGGDSTSGFLRLQRDF
jgi:hypothetical protein